MAAHTPGYRAGRAASRSPRLAGAHHSGIHTGKGVKTPKTSSGGPRLSGTSGRNPKRAQSRMSVGGVTPRY